jgi:hypothetical protein
MIKQNRTKLQFILAGFLMFAFSACNNSSETKEAAKDTTTQTVAPTPAVRDSIDTMEAKPGNVAPGNENKPAPTP